jgi:hypothetical protein
VLIIILKCAGHFVGDVWYAVIVPPIFYVFILMFFTWWCTIAVYLYTSGTIDTTSSLPFGQFKHSKNTYYMFYFFVFGGLWGFAMLLAVQYFILASATCSWYFNFGRTAEVLKERG